MTSTKSSMQLHEVLEEEYVAMYGPLPLPDDPAKNRLDHVIEKIHEKGDRSALCISGGGIRSATFALGVIQGLARAGLLKKFDYLSTVSGGGYIGSWLSSWVRRDREGVDGVQQALADADTAAVTHDPNVVQPTMPPRKYPESKLDPEPQPLRHLREYSNYMSPRLGLLSGDSWTIVAMYVRNLLLNLLVLVPLLAAVLAVPRLFSWALAEQRALIPEALPWLFVVFATAGFAYLGHMRPVDYGLMDERKKILKGNPDWRFLQGCVLALVVAGTMLALFWAAVKRGDAQLRSLNTYWALGAYIAGTTLIPFFLYYRRLWKATVTARRSGFVEAGAYRSYLWSKMKWEGLAIAIALLTSGVLFYLLAMKVFDDPLRATPQLAQIPPLLRYLVPASPQAQLYVCFAVPLVLLVFFVQASIFVGLSSHRNEDSDREWWARAGAWLVLVAVALALVSAISVFGPVALYHAPVLLASVGGVAGVAAALLGFSAKTPANQKEKEGAGVAGKAGNVASGLAVPLFVVFLLASISFGTTWIVQKFGDTDYSKWALPAAMQSEVTSTTKSTNGAVTIESKNTLKGQLSSLPEVMAAGHLKTVQETSGLQLVIIAITALVAFGLSFCIGVNKFSMQALYRNRLIRAYLGASRFRRDPDRFTGFDEDDNLPMWSLRQELLWTTSVRDLDQLVAAMRATALWAKLDEQTRDHFVTTPYERRAKEALITNLNHLLLTSDLREVLAMPEWVKPKDGHLNYSRSFVNRAILDDAFWQHLRVMPVPENAGRELPQAVGDSRAPMHVVNMALNLTTGENLAWQQRMAESFTASPLHTGSSRLAYRNSREYGGAKGISLGTAVAISGAAASPNMGYHSSPVMAFLLTFFNIRLGSWLGNPKTDCYDKAHPSTNLIPFAKEATGSSDDASNWVYLSDGGHFENLGLYEMVLRRCHHIVLSDGGADPKFTFEDLGNAIRKIRTDLGIPIDVYDMQMEPRGADGKFGEGRFVARATIRYSAIDKGGRDGTLVYVKAGIYKDDNLPRDIYNYAQESLLFPHEPTSDQFFSESQFESYRALGRYAVHEICAEGRTATEKIPILKAPASLAELCAPPVRQPAKTGATLSAG